MATTTFVVLNIDNGDFYSESPALKNESKCNGRCWDNTSILPDFARRYMRFKDAVRRAQRLINQTGGDWHAILVTDLR